VWRIARYFVLAWSWTKFVLLELVVTLAGGKTGATAK
jgi:hypothetical protein